MRPASFVALPARPLPARPRWHIVAIVTGLLLLVVLAALIGLQAYVTARSFESSHALVAEMERVFSQHALEPDSEVEARALSAREWQAWSYRISFIAGNVAMLLLVAGAAVALVQLGRRWEGERSLSAARQAVLAAERDRGRFLAAAGHDLRQPLQAMNLFLVTLAQHATDPQTTELVGNVRAAARAMDRMLTGLLDVAKLDAGIVATDRVEFPMSRMIDGFRGEFERLAEAQGLLFRVNATAATVRTDPMLLESILRNLIGNAVKYTVSGAVTVSVRAAGQVAEVTVQDTGPGIPEAEVASIFDDFYRVSGTATRSSGLGLGLGIVRRMAKLIGVQVGVVSTLGVGTTFTLEVPLAQAQPPPAAPLAAPVREPRDAALLARRRVLVVEDDAAARAALRGVLLGWGMEVIAAGTREEACAPFEQGPRPDIEIALVDFHLGTETTGPLLLDHLAASFALAIPAILMTASDDPQALEEIEDSGYPCLRKPLDAEVLKERMLELLDRRGGGEALAASARVWSEA